jgi:hypothetical protein
MGTTSDLSTANMISILPEMTRYSRQFSQQVNVGGTFVPSLAKLDRIGVVPPKKKLTSAQILNLCAIAATLSAGGSVPGGSYGGTASSSPSGFSPERSSSPPDTAGPTLTFDAAGARANAYTNIVGTVGTAASCYAAVSAAQ